MSRRGRWLRLGGAVVVLGCGALTLGLPTRPTLPVGAVDPDVVTDFVVDGLRLLLTVAVWYLLLAATLTALAGLPGVGLALRPVARRVTEAGVGAVARRLVATSAAVGASLPGAAGAGAGGRVEEPPVMVPIDPAALDEPTGATNAGPDRTGPTMIRQPRDDRPSDSAGEPTAQGAPAGPDQHPPAAPTASAPNSMDGADGASDMVTAPDPARPAGDGEASDRPVMRSGPDPDSRGGGATPTDEVDPGSEWSTSHVVARGQSFWTIAEDLARSRSGERVPDLADIACVWQQLVDRNADILVDPGNPDLLHTGQVLDIELDQP